MSEMPTPDPLHPNTVSSPAASPISSLREDYSVGQLHQSDLDPDPFVQFGQWLQTALAAREHDEPTAMTLATASADAIPSARTVLLKGFDARGFTWFTNYQSRKGRELADNPNASLVFRWAVQERQVVICGSVCRVDEAESDLYFTSRPHRSQIGAIVSAQSTVIADRSSLEDAAGQLESIPVDQLERPDHWGGFRLSPISIEFWQGRRSRLHDRFRYRREAPEAPWVVERLSP